jgi:hypothetical protein
MQNKSIRGTGFSFAMALAGLLGGGLLAGVVSSCGTADEAFDCQAVCSKYQECFNNSYDVGACRSRCRDKAAADTDYKRKADTCHACIGERSCTSATFACASDCGSIVP